MAQWFETNSTEKAQASGPESWQNEIAPPRVRRWRSYLFQAGVIVAIGLFGLLALLAAGNPYFSIDLEITLALQQVRAPWFEALMVAISWPGFLPQAVLIGLAAVLLLVQLGLRDEARFTFLCAAGSQVLNLVVKTLVARPRPADTLVEVFQNVSNYSFPSGHVMFYSGLFGFLLFLTYVLMKHTWRRSALLGLFAGMVLLVGPSRIYLGGHWASDVLGAYLLGGVWLAICIQFYRQRTSAREKENG